LHRDAWRCRSSTNAVELAPRGGAGQPHRRAQRFRPQELLFPTCPRIQISQYETRAATGGAWRSPSGPAGGPPGRLKTAASGGSHPARPSRRRHGKLVHREQVSLVDYNRAGVPLLEIVSEPDLHSVDEAKAYATELRSLLRTLGVTSGDMEKGAIRFEANISLRPVGQAALGTRTEIKNLNSFRAMVHAVAFEVERQGRLLAQGGTVEQETRGWDEESGRTLPQRDKEDAHDYRYFPEPDLPPLHIDRAWLEGIRSSLPELPEARRRRLVATLGLAPRQVQLAEDPAVADYFERAVAAAPAVPPPKIAHWMTGELFGLLHAADTPIESCRVEPAALAELVAMVDGDYISPPTGKAVLQRIFAAGGRASTIVQAEGLAQVSDGDAVDRLVRQVLSENPEQVRQYRQGKTAVAQWLFGQVMRHTGGRAKPALVQERLRAQLDAADE
jgi:aspartyl-tRNA(Asn)/glutamyl-tRNA(Gln) amidotransferase subunit B